MMVSELALLSKTEIYTDRAEDVLIVADGQISVLL